MPIRKVNRVNRLKIRLGVILAILLTITICSVCGPSAEPTSPTPTPTPPPSDNQRPEISSLTPAQTQAYPSDMIEIQCNASDADGDAISYDGQPQVANSPGLDLQFLG